MSTVTEDFTGGAQGVWKAFELEANLSVIQAARHARGIAMPDFWSRFCHSIKPPEVIVET